VAVDCPKVRRRAVIDLKATFNLVVQNEAQAGQIEGFGQTLGNFMLCHIMIVDGQNQQQSIVSGTSSHPSEMPDPETLAYLREIATKADGEVAISGIRPHHGVPHFFAAKILPDNRMAFAPWSPAYVIELQKSIAFGERGHSMVVDQDGLVVAHPNAEWQRISKNASKLSVVAAMMAGKTGVTQFFSPPMQADMIAGYTFVPETGWGVMVPQPIDELAARAQDVQAGALVIATAEILLAVVVSLWLSSLLARPIQAIIDSAREVAKGDLGARVGVLPRQTPAEIRQMAKTFDLMVDDLALKTDTLSKTLAKASCTILFFNWVI